ncbi:hypothetical protein T492DRAFT_970656 [Pavlovales sp. CCMP2436]|nr:hypothetical protein T492DRAFT_970656 [Pavlovales sp. CCMP2436]
MTGLHEAHRDFVRAVDMRDAPLLGGESDCVLLNNTGSNPSARVLRRTGDVRRAWSTELRSFVVLLDGGPTTRFELRADTQDRYLVLELCIPEMTAFSFDVIFSTASRVAATTASRTGAAAPIARRGAGRAQERRVTFSTAYHKPHIFLLACKLPIGPVARGQWVSLTLDLAECAHSCFGDEYSRLERVCLGARAKLRRVLVRRHEGGAAGVIEAADTGAADTGAADTGAAGATGPLPDSLPDFIGLGPEAGATEPLPDSRGFPDSPGLGPEAEGAIEAEVRRRLSGLSLVSRSHRTPGLSRTPRLTRNPGLSRTPGLSQRTHGLSGATAAVQQQQQTQQTQPQQQQQRRQGKRGWQGGGQGQQQGQQQGERGWKGGGQGQGQQSEEEEEPQSEEEEEPQLPQPPQPLNVLRRERASSAPAFVSASNAFVTACAMATAPAPAPASASALRVSAATASASAAVLPSEPNGAAPAAFASAAAAGRRGGVAATTAASVTAFTFVTSISVSATTIAADSQADSQSDSRADSRADTQADSQSDSQADRQADRQAGGEAGSQADRQAGSQIAIKQADSRADSQADRQADSQADSQIAIKQADSQYWVELQQAEAIAASTARELATTAALLEARRRRQGDNTPLPWALWTAEYPGLSRQQGGGGQGGRGQSQQPPQGEGGGSEAEGAGAGEEGRGVGRDEETGSLWTAGGEVDDEAVAIETGAEGAGGETEETEEAYVEVAFDPALGCYINLTTGRYYTLAVSA